MWKESVAHAVSLGQGRTRTGLEDWARVAGSDRRRRSRTVLKDGARTDGAIADDVDEDGALEDGVLAADNAPADRGIVVLSWRGLGRVDGARERKGRGDGEGMTVAWLFPCTDDADARTHEGQTDESDCRTKKMSIF